MQKYKDRVSGTCASITADMLNMLNVQMLGQLQTIRQLAVDEAFKEAQLQRNPIWTESVAVGTEQYLGEMKEKLKIRNPRRKVTEIEDDLCLREPASAL